jgi:hypothetical protein
MENTVIDILWKEYVVEVKENKQIFIDWMGIDTFVDTLSTSQLQHLASIWFDILRLTPKKFQEFHNISINQK